MFITKGIKISGLVFAVQNVDINLKFISMTNKIPYPGDLIISKLPMGAWATDGQRKPFSLFLNDGCYCFVIQSWNVGNKIRLRVIHKDKIVMFSCKLKNINLNWHVT